MSNLRILSGEWKGRILPSLSTKATRPTTSQLRQAVFNIWSEKVEETLFLDLFAGSGAMAFEALSLGAKSAVAVESNDLAACTIRTGCEKLGCGERFELWSCSVESFLKRNSRLFNLIYVDPPYDWNFKGLDRTKGKGAYVMELASRLVPHLALEGELIIEQLRHIKEKVESVQGLRLIETRTYGDTLIHRFIKEA